MKPCPTRTMLSDRHACLISACLHLNKKLHVHQTALNAADSNSAVVEKHLVAALKVSSLLQAAEERKASARLSSELSKARAALQRAETEAARQKYALLFQTHCVSLIIEYNLGPDIA